eukprot:TRINITY_DN39368_c0_g1_i1.p1 TRINITY_DN39368_c0_g1~~TRINITY_DN39368_c0_g1_i1.p1  ORF type:complete len:375 (-),score=72.95 TRINITY_DN39368_c0_g1_i1:188-1189(-)
MALLKPGRAKRTKGINKLKSEVQRLRERTQAEAKVRAHKLKVLKRSYDAKIEEEESQNEKLNASVQRLRIEVTKLAASNQQKLKRAKLNQRKIDEVSAEADGLRENLTVVYEGITQTEREFEKQLQSNASELEILAELDSDDNLQQVEKEHARDLRAVAKSVSSSLLQTNAETMPLGTGKLMERLEDAMDELAKEGNRTAAQMQHDFELRLHKVEEEKNTLIKERDELEKKRLEELAFGKSLDNALARLQKTKGFWRSRNTGLRQFLRMLANTDDESREGAGSMSAGANATHKSRYASHAKPRKKGKLLMHNDTKFDEKHIADAKGSLLAHTH